MNRGRNREVLFRLDEDFAYFLNLLDGYQGRFGQRLNHYCLMNNHFHLLADNPGPEELSSWMTGMLRSYVHYHNRRYGFVGHLWQGRFQSPVVGVEEYFLSCARSIERNPVRAGLMTEPWADRWSSCHVYALAEANPLRSYSVWYRALGAGPEQRQARWRVFARRRCPGGAGAARGLDQGGCGAAAAHATEGARPARRRGRPRKSSPGQEGYFPQFYERIEDA